MRLFAALVPPPEVVEDLAEFLRPRQEASPQDGHPSPRWTLPEQWHVTLAFMAAVPDRVLDDLEDRLTRACAKRSPISLSVAGGGAFPHVLHAKVLWAGLDLGEPDREELRRLSVGCRAAAAKSGAEVDGARLHPHLTLARLNRPADVHRWVQVVDTYVSRPWVAHEVTLIESRLGQGHRGRPRYEVAGTYPLGRR